MKSESRTKNPKSGKMGEERKRLFSEKLRRSSIPPPPQCEVSDARPTATLPPIQTDAYV